LAKQQQVVADQLEELKTEEIKKANDRSCQPAKLTLHSTS
jgi:hypothetical protein